jgi:hypothetical protein
MVSATFVCRVTLYANERGQYPDASISLDQDSASGSIDRSRYHEHVSASENVCLTDL